MSRMNCLSKAIPVIGLLFVQTAFSASIECKVTVDKEKTTVNLQKHSLNDEMDILKAPMQALNFKGMSLKLAAGLAGDNDCPLTNKNCRAAIYLQSGSEHGTIAYANLTQSGKVGVVHENIRLSCQF